MAPGSCTLHCKQLNMCTQSHRVYTTAKHWAKESVCTSLDEITVTHSVLIRSERRCPYFQILMVPCFQKIFSTSNIELARRFPSLSWTEDTYLFNLKCFYTCPLADNRAMIYRGNIQDFWMNKVCLFICVRGSLHPILSKTLFKFFVCLLFCVEVWCLTLTPLPLNTNWLCRAVIFARCANLAFPSNSELSDNTTLSMAVA